MSKLDASLPSILNVEEVAEVLRIPVNTARKLCREGKLKSKKVGKHLRIAKTDLERYLK